MRKFNVEAILAARILRQEAEKTARVLRASAASRAFLRGFRKMSGIRRVAEAELLRFVARRGWPEPGHSEEWLDQLFARKVALLARRPHVAFTRRKIE